MVITWFRRILVMAAGNDYIFTMYDRRVYVYLLTSFFFVCITWVFRNLSNDVVKSIDYTINSSYF